MCASYSYPSKSSTILKVDDSESDTNVLSQNLAGCDSNKEICDVIKAIEGPWAFVYFKKATRQLWFGRDYIGRRSLLFSRRENEFVLSSVGKRFEDWNQVPANGIYCFDLTQRSVVCHHWSSVTNSGQRKMTETGDSLSDILSSGSLLDTPILPFSALHDCPFPEIEIKPTAQETISTLLKDTAYLCFVEKFLVLLRLSVKKRAANIPKRTIARGSLGILFSGGVDCSVLALLAHEFVAEDEPITLLNVAFETPKSDGSYNVPDRITGR